MSLSTPKVQSPEQWTEFRCGHIEQEGAWPQTLLEQQLALFEGWSIAYGANGEVQGLEKHYSFSDFEGVKAAVGELTKLADEQDHHPEAGFSFNWLKVQWSTHSAGGLSNNDWACAAQLDKALAAIG